jgi:oligoendopeptidase F
METVITGKTRKFIKQDAVIRNRADVESYYRQLLQQSIHSVSELEQWLRNRSELEAFISEEGGWRYIRMTINTADQEAVAAYEHFISEIEPTVAPLNDKLNEKLLTERQKFKPDREKYFVYLRGIENEKSIFRKENIPLQVEINQEAQRFASIAGAQTIEHEGKQLTLPQASLYLRNKDRNIRQEIFSKISHRREKDVEELNKLFDKLIHLRTQVAKNAGFNNFRDYKFKELGRFDYGVKECEDIHESIRKEIVPLVKGFYTERKKALEYDTLRPWDMEVDISGKNPLHPFNNAAELITKIKKSFLRIDPYFGACIASMNELGHFDLESKANKAPGGYNYPLYETGAPFIFMNAVGTHRDLVTMVHEGGHAIHSFLTHKLELTGFKSFPSEVAELASMGMELISMDTWDEFYTSEEELNRAKREQLEKIISLLPWIATVDKFQHWIYTNPQHSSEQRAVSWKNILNEYTTGVVDYTGYEWTQTHSWQRQLHIFEVPFYYIEYAMAQLGAIALWRNYKNNPKKTVKEYTNALSLGYTRTLPQIYEAAGVQFNFSHAYIKELAHFVKTEYEKLNQ